MSLLGIDIGTQGSKVVIFNRYGDVLSSEYSEHQLLYPRDGWVELDPEAIWRNIKIILKKANQKVKGDKITAFGISCQGEAIIPVDKNGNSLHNAIVTFDSRTIPQYEYWKDQVGKEEIFKITGMPLHPMYSINKIMWLKQNRKDIFGKTYKFLCFEDYIYMKFGFTPTIDHSLAARTMAFDIVEKKWSKKILDIAKIDAGLLPEIKPSGEIIDGNIDPIVSSELGLDKDIHGVTGGHDQACGAFGVGIINENTAMNAIGTSDVAAIVLNKINLDDKMLESHFPCYPYVLKDKYITTSFNLTGGLLLKWYRDNFCFEEKLIAKKEGKNIYEIIDVNIYPKPVNVFVLPHFVGSGTPYMDHYSKGMIIGLDIETDKSKLARAILESTVYDLKLNLELFEQLGITINKVVAIGGGARSSKWLELRSNILNKEIVTLKNKEAASLGAALLAGVAIGEFKSYEDAIVNTVREDKVFSPDKSSYKQYNQKYMIYKDIYTKNKDLLHRISKLD